MEASHQALSTQEALLRAMPDPLLGVRQEAAKDSG